MGATRSGLIASGLVLSCVLLSACGDDDNTPVAGPTATPTSPPTATRTATRTVTPSVPPTATATNTPPPTVPPTLTPTPTIPPTSTKTATSSATATATVTDTPQVTSTPSITATATITPTATVTPTFGVLGTRRFTISQIRSPFQASLSPGFTVTVGTFQGQTNGQPETGFLELEAGQPDPGTGVATINVTASSEFLYADGRQLAGIVICLKPIVPIQSAGIVACTGGLPLGINTQEDHHLGQIGVDGFTPADCSSMNGDIESPNQICAAGIIGDPCRSNADCDTTSGAGDGICGLDMAHCSDGKIGQDCRADADCDTAPGADDGVCGTVKPHPGVCNGPLNGSQGTGDSGVGAVVLAPNSSSSPPLVGLPVRLSIQSSLPCVDPGPGAAITFALTTGQATSVINNFSNTLGQTVTITSKGENFSCADWRNPSGPGKLILNAPALDQNPQGGDIITGFTFSGR